MRIIITVLLVLIIHPAFGIEEIQEENLIEPIITLDETINGDFVQGEELPERFKLSGEYIFAKKKGLNFDNSPADSLSMELRFRGVSALEDIGDDLSSRYPFNINTALEAKFLENKYRLYAEYAFARDVSDMDSEFFAKFSSLYIEQNFNENHKIRAGTSRAPIGLEGSMGIFSLPLINRAQISRNFGNAIATGVSFIGSKEGFEYNFGGYTSTRFSQGFKDGAEFIGRIGYAPFYKDEGGIFQKLKFYTGADIGHRDGDYGVYSAAASYEYDKFLMNFEYAYANGSNSRNYNPNERQGFFTTLGYSFNPKVQLLLRYDCFDPNVKTTEDLEHEYTIGINYFVFKQRLKFALNYTYSNDSAIYFLTQFFI